MRLSLSVMPSTNCIRNYVKIHLPFELTGMPRKSRTYEFKSLESSSYYLQKLQLLIALKLSVNTKKMQVDFIE